MNHKLESRLPGETATTSDIQMISFIEESEEKVKSLLIKVKVVLDLGNGDEFFHFIDYTKAFAYVDQINWKILQEVGIPDHFIYLL